MSKNNQIVIKKDYFDNIKTAIDSINSFFSSNYKKKDFPVVDIDFQLDSVIMTIISWFNSIDPTWIDDPDKVISVIDSLHESTENMSGDIYTQLTNDNNTIVLDHINAFIGFKALQFIGDNFTDFSKLVNGIYTFELFTQPSKFKDVIDTFSQNIPLTEIDDIMGDNTYTIFDEKKYVTGIFNNEQIKLPESMKLDSEINRFSNCNDLTNVEILIDESIQEAAEVNFFEKSKPEHIKYDEKTEKFKISKQFEKTVDDMIRQLKQINSTTTLLEWFTDTPSGYPDKFTSVVIPCVLARVFSNPKKYEDENMDQEALKKYTDSYDSIINKNNGAKRFKNFDLFSTYKTDKEGTLKFLEDFLKLNLVNDEEAYISNNTLLTIFNIFDSRIYLDIMYNILPDSVKRRETLDEDGFVKKIRARINKNSRNANIYKPDSKTSEGNETPTTEQVQEHVFNSLKEMGDMSLEDMKFCEQFHSIINDEISTLGDVMYNKGISQIAIDKYIGESYNIFQEGLIGNLIDKHSSNKNKKKIDERIQYAENKFNVKFSDEYKNILYSLDISKPGMIDPMKGHVHARNIIPYPFYLVYEFGADTDSRHNDDYEKMFSYLSKHEGVNVSGLYPAFQTYTSTTDVLKYPDGKNDIIYADSDGLVYSSLFNKANRLEKVASSLSEFIKTCLDKKFYIKSIKPGTHKLCEYYGYFDDFGEYYYDIWIQTFNDGSISAAALDIIFTVDDDYFSEDVANEIISSFVDTCDRKYIYDEDFEILESLTKFVIRSDGSHDFYFKYKGKELSFKDAGVDISGFFNKPEKPTQESYVQEQELGDIPDYMKNRINLSDESGNGPNVTMTDVNLPPDVPMNPIDDLASSIDDKLQGDGDLEDMLGSGGKNKGRNIVYNITNNYNNSFNRDSNNTTTTTHNDSSTGKSTVTNTTTHNNNSHNDHSSNKTTKTDNSTRKSRTHTNNRGSNNNNNGNNPNDTKGFTNTIQDDDQTFSSGNTIQEVFAFLESEEPLSEGGDAGKPPKGDLLTAAMDMDRKTLSKQQAAKKKVQKVVNTGKAILKPVTRTKQWLTKMIDSLIKRDEDKVKAQIIENPSYRTALYKAMRLAIKCGLTGVAFTISGYLGAAYVVVQGAKLADKQRLKKEVQEEFTTELEILNDKIERASREDTPESRKAVWQMMRLRSKMERMAANSPRSKIKHPNTIY